MLPSRTRFRAWLMRIFVVFAAVCSVFVTAFALPSEIGCPQVFWAASSVHREHVSASLTDRIVRRLVEAELSESDAWYCDAIRIARLTALYAAKGEPDPHFWATYEVLRTSPDQVWPGIVRERKAKLGRALRGDFRAAIGREFAAEKACAVSRFGEDQAAREGCGCLKTASARSRELRAEHKTCTAS